MLQYIVIALVWERGENLWDLAKCVDVDAVLRDSGFSGLVKEA